jgi:ferredoxin-nitrite reductase
MIARELFRDVRIPDCPRMVEQMLAGYLAHRSGPAETFQQFSRRHDAEALKRFFAEGDREA